MRSRGTSVYVKRPEILLSETGEPMFTEPELIVPTLKKSYSAEDCDTLFEDFGPLVKDNIREDFTGDYTTKPRMSVEFSVASLLDTMKSSLCGIEYDEIFGSDETEKTQKLFRGMVIGARGTGKHSLINEIFPEEKTVVAPSEKQQFDLVIRTIEKQDSTERYHLWLKEPTVDRKCNSLIDVYYRTCSVFFLLYDPDNKSTFCEVERELERINEANPNKELFLILVGNKRGNKKTSEVTIEDVASLKERFGVKLFLEVNVSNKEVPADLRTFVECFLKTN